MESKMTKVITYGTFDLLHYGHVRLLERAKELGDYLIVGVTAEDFDKTRGKINVEQSLVERMDAVRATGLADEIIVEEYEGQKIDDIRRYGVDIFTVGSDWVGKFDYLNEYCKVVYLERTQGVSSTEIRSERQTLKVGFVGKGPVLEKYLKESSYVNGMESVGCIPSTDFEDGSFWASYNDLLGKADAVYLSTDPKGHKAEVEAALNAGVHVLCESPIAETESECSSLFEIANTRGLVLMDAIKTAYSTAYARLLLLVKSGRIGRVVSVDSTCTSLEKNPGVQGALECWGPTALLPIVQILGDRWDESSYAALRLENEDSYSFVKGNYNYKGATASFRVASSAKSEGELIISGTEGYIYVPAPWWKTDYFEIRRENQNDNRRYYYQLEGEGIRYQLVAFARAVESKKPYSDIAIDDSLAICRLFEEFYSMHSVYEM